MDDSTSSDARKLGWTETLDGAGAASIAGGGKPELPFHKNLEPIPKVGTGL
jgi:hypothetical protein